MLRLNGENFINIWGVHHEAFPNFDLSDMENIYQYPPPPTKVENSNFNDLRMNKNNNFQIMSLNLLKPITSFSFSKK